MPAVTHPPCLAMNRLMMAQLLWIFVERGAPKSDASQKSSAKIGILAPEHEFTMVFVPTNPTNSAKQTLGVYIHHEEIRIVGVIQ